MRFQNLVIQGGWVNASEFELYRAVSASRIQEHIEALCAYGPRTLGSTADGQAAEYVATTLAEAGAHVSTVPTLIGVTDDEVGELSVGAARIHCVVYGRSSSTPREGITGALTALDANTPESLVALSHAGIRGRVVIVSAGFAPAAEVAEKLATEGAVGVIFTRRREDHLIETDCLNQFGSSVPCVAVGWEDGVWLRAQSTDQTVTVRMYVNSNLRRQSVDNVIGVIQGSNSSGPCTLVVAHRDTVPGSVGANDNASGVSAILELARLFGSHPPGESIAFAATASGEGGAHGARALAESELIRSLRVERVINLDELGTGPVLRAVPMGTTRDGTTWATDQALNVSLLSAAHALGYTMSADPAGQLGDLADAQPFVERGYPTAWVSRGAGYAVHRNGHTSADTPTEVDVNATKLATAIVALAARQA